MQQSSLTKPSAHLDAGRSLAGEPPRRVFSRFIPVHPVLKRTISGPERRTAYLLMAALVAIAVVATPIAEKPMLAISGFLLIYATGLFILNILVSVLLLSKAKIEDNRGYMLLAVAYLFAAFIIVPHLATFPDVLVPGMILGTSGSATWIWVFWHGGFALLISCYALFAKKATVAPGFTAPVAAAALLVAAASYVAVRHVPDLPTILQGSRYFSGPAGEAVAATVLALNVVAVGLVIAQFRMRNAEDLWLTVGMVGACVDVWLTLSGGQRFSLGWYAGRMSGVTTVFVLFGSLLNDVLLTYSSVAAANNVLDKMTQTDALTGLGNRRLFDDILDNEWRRCRRENAPLSVIMIDVDEFKKYNDTYGHQAGDHCLQRIALELEASATRPGDMAVRYGGEEFALILPNTDCVGGEHLAKMIRIRIRELGIPHDLSHHGTITISAGVATLIPSESFGMTELVRLADIALYRAKAGGRDTVVAAG